MINSGTSNPFMNQYASKRVPPTLKTQGTLGTNQFQQGNFQAGKPLAFQGGLDTFQRNQLTNPSVAGAYNAKAVTKFGAVASGNGPGSKLNSQGDQLDQFRSQINAGQIQYGRGLPYTASKSWTG